MRPKSIVMFERLFLASLALALVIFVLSYDEMMAILAEEPAFVRAGLGSGFVIGLVGAVYAIYLLLWYLVAHRASNSAKWIVVVLTVLDLLSVLPSFAGPWDAMLVASFVIRALEIAAIVYLFKPDAVTWLKGEKPTEPSTFD